MADDTSTYLDQARLGRSLRLDQNNETVVSGMTEASWETPSVASTSSSAVMMERNTSESLPPSRFRGGTAMRFGYNRGGGFGGGRSAASGGRSVASSGGGGSVSSGRSRGSRTMDRSTRSVNPFDPIAEVDETSSRVDEMSMSSREPEGEQPANPFRSVESVASNGSRWQRPVAPFGASNSVVGGDHDGHGGGGNNISEQGTQRHRPAAPFSSSAASVASSTGSVWQRPTAPYGASNSVASGGGNNIDMSSSSRGIGGGGFNASGMFTTTDQDNISVTSGLTTGMQSVGSRRLGAPPTVTPFSTVESIASNGSTWQRPIAPYGASNSVAGTIADGAHRHQQESESESEQPHITDDEQANILLNAFDNTRLATHEPKISATKEVDVSYYQDTEDIMDADEITPLPEEYVLDEFGNRYHIIQEDAQEKDLPIDPALQKSEFEMLPTYPHHEEDQFSSPLSMRRRKWYSLITVCAAVSLAVAEICISFQTLSSSNDNDSIDQQATYYSMGDNNVDRRYEYIPPGYQFGGGLGGIVGGQEHERRIMQTSLVQGGGTSGQHVSSGSDAIMPASPSTDANNAAKGKRGYAPTTTTTSAMRPTAASSGGSASAASGGGRYQGGRTNFQVASHQIKNYGSGNNNNDEDPFHGYGPPQFHPGYGIKSLPALTATPLTSYSPPPPSSNSDGNVEIVLDPKFNGAYMDLMILPYNSQYEMPVVWDVPFTGSEVIKSVFGRCLRLVQCTELGKEILEREREMEKTMNNGSGGRRLQEERDEASNSLGSAEKDDVQVSVEGNKLNYLRSSQLWTQEDIDTAPTFNPPLRTEMVYTSTYVNVDCSTSTGIDRGISHNMVTSNMVDVIISSVDIYDTSRLFTPPTPAYGRVITILRDPIERVMAKYKWMKVHNDDENVKGMSLEDFVQSDHLEDNILVRSLSGHMNEGEPLGNIHLIKAKEVLKRKFIVGLYIHMEDSLQRFETFFNWNVGDQGQACQSNEVGRIEGAHYNKVDATTSNNGSSSSTRIMAALQEKVGMDMALYEFATFLYDYQGNALFGIPATS